jgi:hypothetical protein
MNIRRKFLRMVDLRVNHYFAAQRLGGPSRLATLHSTESLAPDHSELTNFSRPEKSAENFLL